MLIFVFGTLVVAGAWGVIEARIAASAAAREAARVYVESKSSESAYAGARKAAEDTLSGYSRELSEMDIAPLTPGSQAFTRCNGIEVVVRARVTRAPIPVLSRAAGTYVVSGRHVEVVDPYRSGLNGKTSC